MWDSPTHWAVRDRGLPSSSSSLCTEHRALYTADAQKCCLENGLTGVGMLLVQSHRLSPHVGGRKWGDPASLSYLFHSQHIDDLVKQGCSQQVSVDQQSLQSVTGSWIFTFRVSD